MHTYTCETPDLQCACCGDIIAIGEEFAVVTTPSEPGLNTCVECAKQKIGSVKHARAEHTLNRKQKAEKEQLKIQAQRDLAMGNNMSPPFESGKKMDDYLDSASL